ncbi:translation initiation factor IF-2-like [Cervus canadensis]|uniref:translation initiation factor IF-2-like n=1 Tax=Cervus canadensis TaxID=1574408 RepID=UPI001C9E75D1|nr:translation initiation factor IF-2-like [Cervus canadensis]
MNITHSAPSIQPLIDSGRTGNRTPITTVTRARYKSEPLSGCSGDAGDRALPPGRKRGPRGQVVGGFQEPEAAWRVAAQVTAERARGERENECRALRGPPRGLGTSLVGSRSPSVQRFQVRDPEGRPQPLRGLRGGSLAPPGRASPRALPGPQAPRGQGLGAEGGREGPGKTTQIALQWARPLEEPVPPSRLPAGRSPRAVPRRTALRGAGPGAGSPRGGGWGWGTTGPPHTHTGRETVAEKVLQLLKESCPARPLRPLLSGSEEIDSEDLERS